MNRAVYFMPNVTNLEVFVGKRPTASPAGQTVLTTLSPARAQEGEVSGHYAASRVIKCWSCGGLSYAVADDALANQVFTCAVCGQVNQL